jgi:hypothetical protein
MSTSPLSPQDIRAAAEVHHELGPEYSDAVVANFVDKLEDVITERVNARLAAMAPQPVAVPRRHRGRVAGAVVGACAAVAIVGGAGLAVTASHGQPAGPTITREMPAQIKPVPPAPGIKVFSHGKHVRIQVRPSIRHHR